MLIPDGYRRAAIDRSRENRTIPNMKVGVLLLTAGSGSRFGGELPKQYVEVAGQALVLHTLAHLAAEPRICVVQPVVAAGDHRFAGLVAGRDYPFQLLAPVTGGAARSVSMQHGLEALPADIDLVAVHDAARPLPSPRLLADVIDTAARFGAAIPGVAVHDTIKRVDADGRVLETPAREQLRAVQTPQVARREWFVEALGREKERLHLHTDDASLLEAAGFAVYVSDGDAMNRKITTPADMAWLATQLQSESSRGGFEK
ncbi:2-C-methyl-D-erythritol 4-phosphate cytidylyltransferase [Mariprofundus erugo]|nr:2-C-methyl-D-erythritol 4-phosphate cytidylyltransferase [Mariprofundus erugo]